MNLVKKRYFFAVMVFAFLGFTIKDEETKVITIPPTFVVDVPQMATATPADATANSELLPTSFTLHTGKSFIGFKEALAYRESRGNYTIVNRFGYMGKYQFGKRALRFYGVTDTEQFLNSPEQQEQVFVLSLQRTKWFLRKEIKKYQYIYLFCISHEFCINLFLVMYCNSTIAVLFLFCVYTTYFTQPKKQGQEQTPDL